MDALISASTTAPLRANQFGKTRGEIAGTAGDIQYGITLAHPAQLDGEAFPHAMYACRHEVVHQVVAGCHRMEYIGHHARLGVFVDLLEAESGWCLFRSWMPR